MAAIIFDLDGTLLDTVPDIRAATNAALADFDRAPLDTATIRQFVGRGTPALIRCIMEIRDLEEDVYDPLHHAFFERYRTASELTCPYPGMIDALDTLAGSGHRLGICTNKPTAPTEHVLRQFDLARRMGCVVAGDTLDVTKPDPAPLRRAMTELGATTCIYLGDSEIDAATAQATGQPFVLFTMGYRKCGIDEMCTRATFDAFADLPGIVSGLGGD